MRFVIELSLLLIIFYCTWRGYRRGAVNAAISLLAVIIAVTGGLAISSSAAPSAAYPLRPLLAGYLDSQLEAEAARSAGIDETRIEDTIREKPELLMPYAESCLESLGFNERRAESYCANAQKVYSAYEIDATTAAAHAGSEAVAYAICSVIFLFADNAFHIAYKTDIRSALPDNGQRGRRPLRRRRIRLCARLHILHMPVLAAELLRKYDR